MDSADLFAALVAGPFWVAATWFLKTPAVNLWHKLVAWWNSAESYAVVLQNRGKALLAKAEAINAAAVKAAKS